MDDTGVIEGYLKLGNQLIMLLNDGGGSGSGAQKTIELVEKGSNVVVTTKTLNQLLGTDTNDLRICTWDTTTDAGKTVYVRFRDSDTASGWAGSGAKFSEWYVVLRIIKFKNLIQN